MTVSRQSLNFLAAVYAVRVYGMNEQLITLPFALFNDAALHLNDIVAIGVIVDKGYELNTWTMNEPEKRAWFESIGVKNIITDDPSLFKTSMI